MDTNKDTQSYVRHLTRSIFPMVLPRTFLVTVLAVIIVTLYQKTNVKLSIDQMFFNVIGIVLSLLLAYRVTASSERYWECINQWTILTTSIRIMSIHIWMKVDESKKPLDTTKDIVTKEIALNWLSAFARATNYYIRFEEGVDYTDLYKYNIKMSNNINDYLNPKVSKIPLPIVISSYLSTYLENIKTKTDESTINILQENLVKIVECFSNLEKVARFPQPLAYSAYISVTVWIYCLALPLQLVANSGWVTIPIVFFMTFILFGAHKIGLKPECPFEYGNDGVECICKLIEQEMDHIKTFSRPTFDDISINLVVLTVETT